MIDIIKIYNFSVTIAVFILYITNRFVVSKIEIFPLVDLFLSCYFNDLLCGIFLISYINSVTMVAYKKEAITQLWLLELILVIFGIIFEYVVPLFRTNTVSDPLDIIAYCSGGFIYHILRKHI